MNKFVSTALGLAVVGSIGAADPSDGNSDWLGLDSGINDLASLAPAQGDGSGWSVLLRTFYGNATDDISTGGGNDLNGFDFNDIDVAFWGSVGDFSYRVNGDLDDGDFELEDAWVRWNCTAGVATQLGQMKPNVLRSGIIDPENTLFLDRTTLGSAFDGWDVGAQASGEVGGSGFSWCFGLFNGVTGEENDHFWTARIDYSFGEGAGTYEGARGKGDGFNGTVGLAVTNDDGISGDALNQYVDFNGNVGQFGFGVDFGIMDDDSVGFTNEDLGWTVTPFVLEGDSNPFAATGSFLINPEWEVGVRFEDLDDSNDTSLVTAGVSHYKNGNDAKWQAQFTDVSSDADEGSFFQIGLTVGATR